MRRHGGLRTGYAWRYGDLGRLLPRAGKHGRFGLAGGLNVDDGQFRDSNGCRVALRFGAGERCPDVRIDRGVSRWRCRCFWRCRCHWRWLWRLCWLWLLRWLRFWRGLWLLRWACFWRGLGRGKDCESLRRRWRGRNRNRSTGSRLLDRCLLRGHRDRRDRRRHKGDLRRCKRDDQIGRLDPSILPWEAETRKPQPLAPEGHAQHQRMNHQREQQRKR